MSEFCSGPTQQYDKKNHHPNLRRSWQLLLTDTWGVYGTARFDMTARCFFRESLCQYTWLMMRKYTLETPSYPLSRILALTVLVMTALDNGPIRCYQIRACVSRPSDWKIFSLLCNMEKNKLCWTLLGIQAHAIVTFTACSAGLHYISVWTFVYSDVFLLGSLACRKYWQKKLIYMSIT